LSVSRSIPSKTVVLCPKDREYITPLIKSLLKQCNRLRRRGQPDKADVVAEKINTLISNDRADRLGKLNTATIKKLWAAVNKIRNAQEEDGLAILHNLDRPTNYFAKVASKENYDPRELESFMCECNDDNFEPLTNIEVEQLLNKIKLTAAGCDGLPAWLLCSCSYELADIVAHILICSFSTGKVRSYWSYMA